jgi:prolipoprotein diacylglyceryltransferase
VIDEEIFIYLSNEELVDREKENLIINLPFSYKGFLSPELLKLNYIPAKINFKTIYYSLGLLVVYCLTEVNLLDDKIESPIDDKIEDKDPLNEVLKSIIGTKLYYFLVRSLDKEPKNRSLNYI